MRNGVAYSTGDAFVHHSYFFDPLRFTATRLRPRCHQLSEAVTERYFTEWRSQARPTEVKCIRYRLLKWMKLAIPVLVQIELSSDLQVAVWKYARKGGNLPNYKHSGNLTRVSTFPLACYRKMRLQARFTVHESVLLPLER